MTKWIREFCLIFIVFIALPVCAAEQQEQSPEEKLASTIATANTDPERTKLLEENKSLIKPELNRALVKEGEALRLRGKYDQAFAVFDIAVRIAEKINDRQGMASAFNGIAIAYFLQNDYKKATEFNEKSLAISEDLQDKPGIANALHNFGMIFNDQGNYDQALEYNRKSLALRREVGDKRKIAFSLNNIGKINYSQGNFKQALDNFNQALQLVEELQDSASSAIAHNNLGTVYERLGNFNLALAYYSKSLKLREALGLKPGIATALANIGVLSFHEGNYDAALDSLKNALRMQEEIKDKRGAASVLTNIGDVYQAMKDHVQAMEYYEQSLNLREELSDKEGIGETLNEIGKVYYSENKIDRAREYYEKSLAVHESMQDKEGIALSLLSLAEVKYADQNYNECLDLCEKVASTSREEHLRDTLWQAQAIAGKTYLKLGKQSDATEAFQEAINSIESLRMEVVEDEPDQQSFLEDKLLPYHSMLALYATQGNNTAALTYAERVKSRILGDVLRSGKVDITKNLTEQEQLEEQGHKNQLVSLNSQLMHEKQKDQPDENYVADLIERLQKSHLDYESFRRNLYTVHHELRVQRGEAESVEPEDAISLLPNSSSAILEFVVTDEKTFLLVLTKNNGSGSLLKIYPLQIKESDLVERARNFREKIANREVNFRNSAKEIYQLLIQPAAAQLKGHSELIIVPDSILWELPFQALINPADRYLLQDFTISYVPSLSVLKEMKKLSSVRSDDASPQLLAFGNPATETATVERVKHLYRDEKLEPLPEAEHEVKALAKLYGQQQSKVYFGEDAQEARFKSESGKYQVLHLATHGILNDIHPMYSQIVFALNGSNTNEDGLLEAWEIMNLNLNAKLAVLSACDTALGRIRKGEGMIGLSWALFVAGVPSTVVSQWKVESASTTELMLEFHKQLMRSDHSQISKAQALRSSALKLMKNTKYRHPFYWASFVLVGDGN